WLAVWITAPIGVLLIAWFIVSIVGSPRWWGDWVPAISTAVAILFLFFGVGAGGFGVVDKVHDGAVHSAVVSELENLGFDNVLLDDDSIIASRNGEYFEGVLVEKAPLAYEVREIVEMKK